MDLLVTGAWIVEALGDKGKLVGYYECRDEPQAMRLAWILREDDIEALVYPEEPAVDE